MASRRPVRHVVGRHTKTPFTPSLFAQGGLRCRIVSSLSISDSWCLLAVDYFQARQRLQETEPMRTKSLAVVGLSLITSLLVPDFIRTATAIQPNIVVILTDDQGYADISLNPHHPQEVSTPNMDALAADGVAFSQAYTSGPVCSPTRAGLMLGRYQQRVGVYSAGDGGRGFDPVLPIFPAFLPNEYVSTAIGKWHLERRKQRKAKKKATQQKASTTETFR
jgi:hypothetical protein